MLSIPLLLFSASLWLSLAKQDRGVDIKILIIPIKLCTLGIFIVEIVSLFHDSRFAINITVAYRQWLAFCAKERPHSC